MRGRYPYQQLNWYPHLSPGEAAIWHKFVAEFPGMYDTVDYDVKVGAVPGFVSEHADPAMQAQAPLYQYKIDVVGYKADQVDIIELKQDATMRALGQVKGYRTLFIRDVEPGSNPKCVVITNSEMPDMGHLAADAGVQLVVV